MARWRIGQGAVLGDLIMLDVSPAKRVRIALAEERRRGADFDLAWERALAAAGREDWSAALDWAREEFRTAYERRAGRFDAFTPLERAAESRTTVVA